MKINKLNPIRGKISLIVMSDLELDIVKLIFAHGAKGFLRRD